MTQEYEFFKQFAGVTELDLEALKCGGKMKKKAIGGALAAGKIGGIAGKVAKKQKSKLTSEVKTKNYNPWDEGLEANVHSYPNTKLPKDTVVHNISENTYYRYANGAVKPSNAQEFKNGRKGKRK